MEVIKVRNVNHALPLGLTLLYENGVARKSRGGNVIEYPEPVTTVYTKPRERVLFSYERNANPFFHFMEGLWMLEGRNDVASISNYVKRMLTYSDDGKTLQGAYGHRWRNHFGIDQLLSVVNKLQVSPEDRRVVLTMWDPTIDLGMGQRYSKDIPCNTHVYFKIRDNRLLMTVCCRSNDIIWGTYGANAVHMSMLQEFVANALGVEVGVYTQISDSYHAYEDVYTKLLEKIPPVDVYSFRHVHRNPYESEEINTTRKMVSISYDDWLIQLSMFLQTVFNNPSTIHKWYQLHYEDTSIDSFLWLVATPIAESWAMYKEYQTTKSSEYLERAIEKIGACVGDDWRVACREWLERKQT